MTFPDFEKISAVKQEELSSFRDIIRNRKKGWANWSDSYHERRKDIEEKHRIVVLGQGRESFVFTTPELPDTLVLSFADNEMRSWDDRRELIQKTFNVKVKYYLNRIMKTLFPSNFARLHFASYNPDLGEVLVREKIKAVSDDYFESSTNAPWARAAEVDMARAPTMKLPELQRLLFNNDFPVVLDDANPDNTITTAQGDVYVDSEFLILTPGSPLAPFYRPDSTKQQEFARLKKESYGLGAFLDYIDSVDYYSDADTRRVMASIDRIKELTEEFLERAKEWN